MSAFTIYPAIDLRAGSVVRLQEGDPARQTSYSDTPAEVARHWLKTGAHWLHVVNLDGAFAESDKKNQTALREILKIAVKFNTHVQFGGGIRSLEMVERALDLGVRRVVVGTIAVEQPQLVADALNKFGPQKIAVAIDAKGDLVRVRGWKSAGEPSAINLALQMRELGVLTLIFTDIRRDGLRSGLNISATRALADACGLDVIASGGVHTLDDVMAARSANLAGVIIGRALYEGNIDLRAALESTSPGVDSG
jgi:phosphoribosylformimino-5-aminoimidazole carboxamide ribotide isomerase